MSTALRAAFRVVLLDEYQDTSAAQAIMLRGLFSGRTPSERTGPPGDGGRRPVPGHLRLARCRGQQHHAVRRGLPPRRRADRPPVRADREPAKRTDHPRRRQRAQPAAPRSRRCRPVAGAEAPDGLGLLRRRRAPAPGRCERRRSTTWPEEVSWIADQVVSVPTQRRGAALGRHRRPDPAQRRHRAALRRADRPRRAGRDRRVSAGCCTCPR